MHVSSSEIPEPEDVVEAGDLERKPAEMLTVEEKQMAMFCHLSSLLGYLVAWMSFVGPLIFWLIKKDTSPYVDYHGKESLNFHLNMLVYNVVGVFLIPCFFIGVPVLGALFIFSVVCVIIGGVRANEGVYYRYPLVMVRLIK
jgi:uncharacterized protein